MDVAAHATEHDTESRRYAIWEFAAPRSDLCDLKHFEAVSVRVRMHCAG